MSRGKDKCGQNNSTVFAVAIGSGFLLGASGGWAYNRIANSDAIQDHAVEETRTAGVGSTISRQATRNCPDHNRIFTIGLALGAIMGVMSSVGYSNLKNMTAYKNITTLTKNFKRNTA